MVTGHMSCPHKRLQDLLGDSSIDVFRLAIGRALKTQSVYCLPQESEKIMCVRLSVKSWQIKFRFD